MRRWIILFSLISLFLLGACTVNDQSSKPEDSNPVESSDPNHKNVVHISYASWGDPEIEQRLIEKFEEAYPHIKVYYDQSIAGSGREFTLNLVDAAMSGTIPDVFVIDNVPIAMHHNLAYDIAELWNNDPETKKVYPNIAATGVYGDKRYAAPSYQFVRGILINTTLLEEKGFSLPYFDWTYEEMIQLARDFTDPSKHMYGFNGGLNFDATIPSLDDKNLGYHAWDGQRFNFTNPLWIKGFKLNRDLVTEGVVEAMTAEEKEAVFGQADAWPFIEGHALMSINGSWDVPYVIEQFKSAGYEMSFYPYPGGTAGQRIPVVLDYMMVSSKTTYPAEAYELLKWMSFGEEGWKARLEIMEELGKPVTAFPVADFPDVWEHLREIAGDIDGMQENIDLLVEGLGIPDTDKWLPGYNEFHDNWLNSDENEYAGLWDTMSPESIAQIYEENMNRLIDEAFANLKIPRG